MAIDPKLVSIKTAGQLPVSDPSDNANFLFYEGDTLQRSPMSNIYDKVSSGLLPATTATVPEATGFHRYLVHEAGTYTNFGGIVVSAADLDIVSGVARNEVVLEVNEGVATKRVTRKMGDSAVANPVFNPANNTEAPTMKGAADYVDNEIEPFKEVINIGSEAVTLPFTLSAGSINTSGVSDTSVNWLNTLPIDIDGSKPIFINGYGTSNVVNRLFWYTQAGAFISLTTNANMSQPVPPPATAKKLRIQVAAGTGVGSSPGSSTYNTSMTIVEGISAPTTIDGGAITGVITTPQMTELAAKKFYSNEGVPQNSLGQNSDTYLDKLTMRLHSKNNGVWDKGISITGREKAFTFPVDFTFQPKTITERGDGGFFLNGFKGVREEFVQSYIDSLTPYYIHPISGSNANNGLTREAPFKTLPYAISQGARLIYLQGTPGFYDKTAGFGTATVDIATSQPLILIGEGNVIMCHGEKATNFTWTANGGCWQTVRGTVNNVMDFDNLDSNGFPTELIQVTSIADCQSTPNSYFPDTSNLYVHPLNNAAPTSKIEICINGQLSYTTSANVPFVYFENIGFATNNTVGAMRVRSDTTVQHNTKVYLNNCYGFKNKFGNIFSIDNLKECWVQNCRAYKPKNDGFNYHTSLLTSGYVPMKVVEINNYAEEMGKDFPAETSSNGSTMHEGGTIIRMNCTYLKGRGGNVADVGAGIRALNLNVVANGNYATNGGSFLLSDSGSKMWLYNCQGLQDLATQYSVTSGANTNSYTKGNDFNQQLIGSITPVS